MKHFQHLIFLLVFLVTTVCAAGAKGTGTGYVAGKILTQEGKALSGGIVMFFDASRGLSPFTRAYRLLPDYSFPIEGNGSFSAPLPEGSYYLMALKKISGAKTDVAPDEGDLLYPTLSGRHTPITVKADQTTELGVVAEAAAFAKPKTAKGKTLISGKVLDADGKPVAGVLIMASETAAMKRPFFVADSRTDIDGRYLVGVPQGGRYYLRAKGQKEIVVSAKALSGSATNGIDLRPPVTPVTRLTAAGSAGPCSSQDFETSVAGINGCLAMRKYGYAGPSAPQAMLVWLHGDLSAGGAANYQFALAEQIVAEFPDDHVLSVALVRPGYPDGTGRYSSGNCYSRLDTYTAANVAEVGAAIEGLRRKYRPTRVILVGDSGGAAMAAVLLGMKPELAEAAVLVACPCDLVRWRADMEPWTLSENPLRWAGKVSKSTKVIALTGSEDLNTPPGLAKAYVKALRAAGVNANFEVVDQASHGDVLGLTAVTFAIARLLH